MRLIRNPELKGILVLLGIALVLAVVLLGLTGTLTDWFGFRFTLKKPLTDSIVFISDRNGPPDVWVMKSDGSNQRALTNDAYEESEPVVSPDGYTIIFISKQGTTHNQLYAIDSDGTHKRRITNITGVKSRPSFSADGKWITFLCAGDVWRVGRKGEHPDRVLPTEQQEAMTQPGQERAPYVWAEASDEGNLLAAVQTLGEIQVAFWMDERADAPRMIVQDLPEGQAPMAGETVQAAWAPGSKQLAITVIAPDGSGVLATADFELDSVRPLLGGGALGSPAWSPDGGRVVAEGLKRVGLKEYGSMGLVIADTYGGDPKLLVESPASRPKWSPDGESIIYVQDDDIYSVDPDTGETRNLTRGRGANSDHSWAPASK